MKLECISAYYYDDYRADVHYLENRRSPKQLTAWAADEINSCTGQ
ncbi:MAG TPA: hypothetical protein V6D26_07780 [Stenomitos sp.]